ncbi:MAG: PD-(D/E)XK nuclease family protein [Patescibacteria group bacterium]|nr:PD-(D/E)XK nuclease family protein [Patescibacteria group bacterium]
MTTTQETLYENRLSPIDVPRAQPDDWQGISVTTIIGALDKPALVYWSAEETAKAAIRIAGSLPARITEDGEEAVIKYLRDARFQSIKGRRTANELGTAVHAACEEYALTGIKPQVDDEVQPFLDRFDAWLDIWQPVYEAVETSVYSPKFGYAGTLDAIMRIDGQLVMADYKTSRESTDKQGKPKRPYPEVALQLAAYRHAEFAATWHPRRTEKFKRRYYLLSDLEQALADPVPVVDGGIVISITPDAPTRAYPVRCDQEVFESFLAVADAFRFVDTIAKSVIGDELIRGH